jgi:WD40 repeat protein
MVAVGEENGSISLIESAKGDKIGFSKATVRFQAHNNAILDLQFSSDDRLLATASGDQSSRIIDALTQKTICTLERHTASLRQVRFQPESGNRIVVTSSRDGNVNVWDLRSPQNGQREADDRIDPNATEDELRTRLRLLEKAVRTDQIRNSHSGPPPTPKGKIGLLSGASAAQSSSHAKPPSVTSLEFVRPNIFVTGSEANSCIKVWDMRHSYSIRRDHPKPISTTREPESHGNYRKFGITSMCLNVNLSHLYAVCSDSTVYAYSTSHLILGHAPELTGDSQRPRAWNQMNQVGLGPLYGFRHHRLKVGSFYIKASVRKARNENTELLAVSSSDDVALIFPTDEKLLAKYGSRHNLEPNRQFFPNPVRASQRPDDNIPIHVAGTVLCGGHNMAVGGVAWTYGGAVATVGDDHIVRCWYEGKTAWELRNRKYTGPGGSTIGWGWSQVEDEKDDEV